MKKKQRKKIFKTDSAPEAGLKYGFRSGFEEEIQTQLKQAGINPRYEAITFTYIVSEVHNYTPDFPVCGAICIETKGRFRPSDRMKMLKLKKQYPDIDFRFVFQNSSNRILKTSKTTYGKWCEKHGFKYADKTIPKEWIEEIKQKLKEDN